MNLDTRTSIIYIDTSEKLAEIAKSENNHYKNYFIDFVTPGKRTANIEDGKYIKRCKLVKIKRKVKQV